VSNAAKIIAKMRRNRRDWRIDDLLVIARSLGIEHAQHGTSHVVFRHPAAGRLTVPAHRPIKPPYVRLFVDFIDQLNENHEN
jgi:hypothetical protein